ncbi:MAG: gas vesicle protein GvpD P-loop domain-containing protein [Candidatus Freyarchaeota archaeon]
MSTANLPQELVEASKLLKCYKLLVKGAPGTGKTLLALGICEFLNRGGTALYISTRVTPEELYETYPWVRKLIPPKNVLDATESRYHPPEDVAVAFKYVEKPAFIQAMYELCSQKPKPNSVIVDSLEALKENLQVSIEDYSLESSMIEISRTTGTNLILVSETDHVTPVDYLVDGIVKQVKIDKNVFVRVTEIQKLRGINVNHPRYLFTLEGGRYRVLPPQRSTLDDLIKSGEESRFEPIKNVEGKISTGIKYLDTITGGGYSYGSVNLIEVNRGVGEAYDYFYLPTIYNYALSGGRALIIPPSGISAQVMKGMIEPVVGEEKLLNCVKIVDFQLARKTDAEKEPWAVILEGNDLSDDYQILYEETKALRRGQKSVLVVISTDTLESVYGWQSKGRRDISYLIPRGAIEAKQTGNTALCLTKYGQERIIDYINHISDEHFNIINVEGTVLIHGIFPYFPAMHPTLERSENGLKIDLTPIV